MYSMRYSVAWQTCFYIHACVGDMSLVTVHMGQGHVLSNASDAVGYGFVSFSDAVEGAKALREMNGKYIGNRPCKLRKSSWEERTPQNAYKGKRKGSETQGNQAKKPGIFHK